MKNTILLLTTLLAYNLSVAQTEIFRAPINPEWQFRQADESEWNAAIVPGCVHTDLIRNGMIKHPFYGTNEKDCQWVGEKDWIYETVPFEIPDSLLKRSVIRMRFNGIDTYADIFINEKQVLQTNNAHRSWELDVKNLLRPSGNVIRIYFHSPLPIADELLKDLPYPLPGAGKRAVVRKPQFHYGWDWGPELLLCGITKSIELIAYDNARFTDIYIEQLKVTEQIAQMKTTFTIHADKDQEANILFELVKTGDNWSTDVRLKRGMNLVELPFEIAYPFRWWCNGQGNQNLYEFNIVMSQAGKVLDSRTERTGIRSIKLVTEKDSIGESFYFTLNEKPVFIKGANFIPLKYFPGEATENDYRDMLTKCRNANINMLRVWGGGVYEDDIFYRLCDEMGIMVWQDFMFACSMYPADSVFVTNVIEEANEQTIRLRNHPCMALWCGNNENAEGWERWGWQVGLSEKQKFQIWRAYKDVFDLTLSKVVKRNTNLDYWESSPRYGRGDERSLTEGDSHYWGVWHDEEPFEVMQKKIPRFMSEFGMQSYPSEEVLGEMMSGSTLKSNDPGIDQHQKHNRGFKLMEKYMNQWYPKTPNDDVLKYARMTQIVQAEGITLGIEAQRRAMPRCMGTMYWQLNDVWPAFSWSGIDYKGKPKLLHDYLQTVYAPQLISCVVEKNNLNIYWISDSEVPEDSLVFRFHVYDDDHLPSSAIFNLKDAEGAIYSSEPTGFRIRYGVHLLQSIPLAALPFKGDVQNKVIEALLTIPNSSSPAYRRVQKVVYESDKMVVPKSEPFVTYEGKAKKRKQNTGIGYEKLK